MVLKMLELGLQLRRSSDIYKFKGFQRDSSSWVAGSHKNQSGGAQQIVSYPRVDAINDSDSEANIKVSAI
jgi:hypothetical protein